LSNQSAAIIRAITDAFGVSVSEDDLLETRTLADFTEFLRRRKGDRSREQIEKVSISFRLRIGLREISDINSATVTDDTRLDSLLPRTNRQNRWIALEDAAQLTLPSLTHPRWLAIGLLAVFLVSMGVGIGFFWTGWSTAQRLFALSVAPFWPFMLWWMSLYFTRGLARSFPHDCQTFGQLVKQTVRINPAEPPPVLTAEANDAAGQDDLDWKLLQAVIASETGRSIEAVSPHTQISEIL
jgi:hypothetical protein